MARIRPALFIGSSTEGLKMRLELREQDTLSTVGPSSFTQAAMVTEASAGVLMARIGNFVLFATEGSMTWLYRASLNRAFLFLSAAFIENLNLSAVRRARYPSESDWAKGRRLLYRWRDQLEPPDKSE